MMMKVSRLYILFVAGLATLGCKTVVTPGTGPNLGSNENDELQINERSTYNSTNDRNHNLIHTLLRVDFDWKQSRLNGEAELTLKPYFYPTSSDTQPNNNLPMDDTGNSANSLNGDGTNGSFDYPLTDVGSYRLSSSSYGTFDQGGNVFEWNDNRITTLNRGRRGGAYFSRSEYLSAAGHPAFFESSLSYIETSDIGFRVASIPEPTTYALALAALCLAMNRRPF